MGYNYHGKIQPNSNEAYIRTLEYRIAELERPKRRKLKKWDFSKIMSSVDEKDYPWV